MAGELVLELEEAAPRELTDAEAGAELRALAREVGRGCLLDFDSVLKRCGVARCDATPAADSSAETETGETT